MIETIIKEKVYTIDDYLAFEKNSIDKHEFHNGKIIKMPGGTFDHSVIALNFATALKIVLKTLKTKGRVGGSDIKIWLKEYNRFVYPDICLIIGTPSFHTKTKTSITNPTLVVEVLSKSTRDYDKGSKFDLYRSLPSFTEYILIEQDTPEIINHYQEEKDLWRFQKIEGIDKKLTIKSLNCQIALIDIYEDIDFGVNEAVSD